MRLIDADHLRRWILSRVFKTQLNVADVVDQIDREDTIEPQPERSIAKWQEDFRGYINMLNIPRDDYKGIMEYINDVPSAQAERKKGEWVDTEFLKLKECSCCHSRWGMYDVENFDFCPNCGADMKGEDDE